MKTLFTLLTLFISTLAFSQSPCPCCTENHRAFDFWLGEWETTVNENLAGHNSIKLIQDSCVLVENWTSVTTPTYTGTSYSFYNRQLDRWEQIWVDNQGGNLHIKGKKKGNQMILQSDPVPGQDGNPLINRVTWTANEDGTVRQHWEISRDDGQSWTSAFDGLYKKKKE